MKKIMFSDKMGLTEAVLKGKKTMTDREMLCRVRLYTDDSKSGESGSKKEPVREEVKNENKMGALECSTRTGDGII